MIIPQPDTVNQLNRIASDRQLILCGAVGSLLLDCFSQAYLAPRWRAKPSILQLQTSPNVHWLSAQQNAVQVWLGHIESGLPCV